MSLSLDRAGVLLQQGRYDLLERAAVEALRHEPDSGTAHAVLALSQSYQKNNDASLITARRAVALDPESAYARHVHAAVLFAAERLEEAREESIEALTRAPGEPAYFALHALIELARRRIDDALLAADEGLARDPTHLGCAQARALALLEADRGAEAERAVDFALSRGGGTAQTFALRGWVCLRSHRYEHALLHFREALRLEPRSPMARRGLREALQRHSRARRLAGGIVAAVAEAFEARPLLLLALTTVAFAFVRQAAAAAGLWVTGLLAALYVMLFFARTAKSVFHASLLWWPSHAALLRREEREFAWIYLVLTSIGMVSAVAAVAAGSAAWGGAAFGCLVLAATVDHLDPVDCPFGRRVREVVVQGLRIGGMAGLLAGFYVAGAAALLLAVAAYPALEARPAGPAPAEIQV